MKKTITGVLIFACASLAAAGAVPYKVIVPMHEAQPGTIVYLTNFDTGEKVDSAAVADEHVTFTGDIDDPWVGRLICDGNRLCTFIVEEGTVSINREQRKAVGMMLNDEYNALNDNLIRIEEDFSKAQDEAEQQALYNKYVATALQYATDNADSPIGYLFFLEWANLAGADEMMAMINENPWLKDYNRVNKLVEGAERKLSTSEGKPFVDFEVEYNGTIRKLSDYVGNGQYTLVDFWASWCGPCIQEIKTIKEIYNRYADKGLQVLGVAVWDEPENTEAAIKRLNLPWPVIINSQNIATDLYGIPAIPCIIVFGPDGTIVSRDARGAELKAVVAAAMGE